MHAPRSAVRLAILVGLALLLGSCGSSTFAIWRSGGASAPVPRTVPITLHAAERLNVDARGQPLALAVRIYQLRQKDGFEAAPQTLFIDAQREREQLGADLISVREVMLTPGQRHQGVEPLAQDANYLGIVALFHTPASGRWRAIYPVPDALRRGLNIGLHACAMSSATPGAAAGRVGTAQCPNDAQGRNPATQRGAR